jgi:hypothetical protein
MLDSVAVLVGGAQPSFHRVMAQSFSGCGHHFLKKVVEYLRVFLVGKVSKIRDTHRASEG